MLLLMTCAEHLLNEFHLPICSYRYSTADSFLIGPIPTEFGKLVKLEILDLSKYELAKLSQLLLKSLFISST